MLGQGTLHWRIGKFKFSLSITQSQFCPQVSFLRPGSGIALRVPETTQALQGAGCLHREFHRAQGAQRRGRQLHCAGGARAGPAEASRGL